MAFELGLFLGCCEFGGKGHGEKLLNSRSGALAISKVAIRPQRPWHSGAQRRPQASHHRRPKLVGDGIAAFWPAGRLFLSSGNTGDSGRSFRAFVGAPNSEYL